MTSFLDSIESGSMAIRGKVPMATRIDAVLRRNGTRSFTPYQITVEHLQSEYELTSVAQYLIGKARAGKISRVHSGTYQWKRGYKNDQE